MSKSPWGNIGAWAAEAERAEAEEKEQAAAEAAAAAARPTGAGKDSQSFPSLKEAASTKQKKKTKMSLQEFTMQSTYTTPTGYGSGSTTRLTPDEMLRLPTGPKERSAEEMQYGGRLGGGFSSYGGSRSMGPPRRDREGADGEGSWGGGGNRRSYGGFDDDRRGPPSRASDFDQPSRADEVDNWASMKKPLPPPSLDSGPARTNRYGSLGTGGGGISRADGDDNWGASKKPIVSATPPPQGRSWLPDSRGPEPERWTREVATNHERQRLVLDPPKMELGSENVNETVVKVNKPNPFGAARPREEVLAEKGLDWKKLDMEIEVKKGSRPTSSQSSRPGSSHSARSEGPAALQGGVMEVKPKPKVNPFGDAKPREVLLEEKGLDWKKIDLELEHRRVDRPETEEEKNLKEEIEQLRKEAMQSSCHDQTNLQNVINQKERDLELLIRDLDDKVRFGQKRPGSASGREKNLKEEIEQLRKEAMQSSGQDQTNLQNVINQKEWELELLIRDLDDKVRFSQKPIQRPGSGSGRATGLSERSLSQSASYEDRRAGEQMDRPRSRGGDAWARPNDPMERPRSRGGVDAWARPNEQVERPRSRGGGDGWTRPPSDERRSFQGGRGGFFGSRESDRTRSRDRW
ncbi:PREDICTED: eukaryotic translation initiation factor 4B2 [Nicotiana attenuata]|uniref:Eukaryotic translation initiation factor 4b1 n=1 Tax=Nicotiana attenuata TaxID=49451 RepID=A0A1J6J135_NICAT|nr:PREDICTED: eukaryotic translation initiation factor 4B2 [Nicotiana attenuata]OIT04691.1 eukaryotic translation initiation factor 4b1 [Nicotiana attenuata]